MEKKQSSVEYLMDKLFDTSSMVKEQLEYFEQAKAMHREETEHYGAKCCMMTLQKNQWSLEQLYNETFEE